MSHSALSPPPQVRSGERRRASESELVKLEEKVLRMEAEQQAVLTSMGDELDAACRSLARNGEDKLQVNILVFSLLDGQLMLTSITHMSLRLCAENGCLQFCEGR